MPAPALAGLGAVLGPLAQQLGVGLALNLIMTRLVGPWAAGKTVAAQNAAATTNATKLAALQAAALGNTPTYNYNGQLFTYTPTKSGAIPKGVHGGSGLGPLPPSYPTTLPKSMQVQPKISPLVKAGGMGANAAHAIGNATMMVLPYVLSLLGNTTKAAGDTAGAVAKAGGQASGALVQALGNLPGALAGNTATQRELYGELPLETFGKMTSELGKAAGVGLGAAGEAAGVAGSSVGNALGGTLNEIGGMLKLQHLMNTLSTDPTMQGSKANLMSRLLTWHHLTQGRNP
jgi:hypothetical protein